MSKKIKIRVKRSWVAYPGSPVQQNYSEALVHGYLLWDIENRNNFDVKFCELPNPRPFVTIDWAGTVEKTLQQAENYPPGTRYRIRSKTENLVQKEVTQLMQVLQEQLKASEVTFKMEQHVDKDLISAGTAILDKEDLRNPDVLLKLLRDYHTSSHVTENEWLAVKEQVSHYLGHVLNVDDIARNTKWSLRHLKWDNCFSYGEGNVINFDGLSGIVGIFGPNRQGKSSIVGTILYGLFNTSDRGNIKNLHVVNVRHGYAYVRAIINSGGVDYIIVRQTVKHEDRWGKQHANTHLNVFRVVDGELEDLCGEERKDTDRVIRKLIGTGEDALLTSIAAQDDIKQYINQGSTKRRQTVSRFLDLDIFDKMYELAKDNVNTNKALLRSLPDRDWPEARRRLGEELERLDALIIQKDHEKHDVNMQLNDIAREELLFRDVIAVTPSEVEKHRCYVESLRRQANEAEEQITSLVTLMNQKTQKVGTIEALLRDNDVDELKKRLEAYNTLEATVDQLRVVHEKEATLLKQQQRSLKILDDVPCGDQFPGCRFIKDAHKVKDKVKPQEERVDRALEKLNRADEALQELRHEDLSNRVTKLYQLRNLRGDLLTQLADEQRDHDKKSLELTSTLYPKVRETSQRLVELEEALKNEENAEAVALRYRKEELQKRFREADTKRLELATTKGKVMFDSDKLSKDQEQREGLLHLMKAHELIAQAFSKKGIPNLIITSQLPVINAEISKILTGIVDFNIELEVDNDSDSMEVYINYGDSRRPIELGSGMEKTIASISLRVALINLSSLPKTDMFIIDEAFGPMDPSSIEACNRLLTSLKRYFKTIIVITHVEGVKDVTDHIIEVNKVENDARVVYNEAWPTDKTSTTE